MPVKNRPIGFVDETEVAEELCGTDEKKQLSSLATASH